MSSTLELLQEALGESGASPSTTNTLEILKKKLPMATWAVLSLERFEVLGGPVIAASPQKDMKPAALIKQAAMISNAASTPLIVRLPVISPYLRRILIESDIGFLADDGEFYMPGAIRLRASKKVTPRVTRGSFSPATKLVALILLDGAGREFSAFDIAEAAHISRASAKRALVALSSMTPLGRRVAGATGRTYLYHVEDAEAFAEAASDSFGSTVREHFLVEADDTRRLPLCGLSALAERSMLSHPKIEQVAAAPREATALRSIAINEDDSKNPMEVNVIDYDFRPLVRSNLVDPFTMCKTIRGNNERIQLALEEASKETPWLKSIS